MSLRRLLTRPQLAKALGCDPRTVAKWQDEGMPVSKRGRGGRPSLYDRAACLAWKDARQPATDAPIDVAKERAFREHWQGVRAKLAAEREARRLLDVDEVERAWSTEQAAVRAKLLALPQAYADRLARAVTAHGVAGAEQAIREMVDETLTELSAGPPAKKRKGRRAA